MEWLRAGLLFFLVVGLGLSGYYETIEIVILKNHCKSLHSAYLTSCGHYGPPIQSQRDDRLAAIRHSIAQTERELDEVREEVEARERLGEQRLEWRQYQWLQSKFKSKCDEASTSITTATGGLDAAAAADGDDDSLGQCERNVSTRAGLFEEEKCSRAEEEEEEKKKKKEEESYDILFAFFPDVRRVNMYQSLLYYKLYNYSNSTWVSEEADEGEQPQQQQQQQRESKAKRKVRVRVLESQQSLVQLGHRIAQIGRKQDARKKYIFHLHWIDTFFCGGLNATQVKENSEWILSFLEIIKQMGWKIIWTVHNILSFECGFTNEESLFRQGLADLSDLIHLMCKRTTEMARPYYILHEEKTRTIPHISYFGVYPVTPLGLTDDQARAMVLGSIIEHPHHYHHSHQCHREFATKTTINTTSTTITTASGYELAPEKEEEVSLSHYHHFGETGQPNNDITVLLFFGWLRIYHGLRDLVDAFESLYQNGRRDLVLVVVGKKLIGTKANATHEAYWEELRGRCLNNPNIILK